MFIVASELHLYSLVLMKIWRDVSSSEHVLGRPSSIEQDDHSLDEHGNILPGVLIDTKS